VPAIIGVAVCLKRTGYYIILKYLCLPPVPQKAPAGVLYSGHSNTSHFIPALLNK